MTLAQRIGRGFLVVLSLYFVVRAAAEFFVVDFNDPASYRDDWGGPSLAGVRAVHCVLGGVGLVTLIVLWRRRSARRAQKS